MSKIIKGKSKTTTVKIFVADIAAYRDGVIHGVWLDPAEPVETLQAHINTMLAASPVPYDAREWCIHDIQGIDPFYLGTSSDLEAIHQKALNAHRTEDLLTALNEHFDDNYETAGVALDDGCYQGAFDSVAAYAKHYMEDIGDITETLDTYINYDQMGDDMIKYEQIFIIELEGEDKVHVFVVLD